jgi:hypothetical protein
MTQSTRDVIQQHDRAEPRRARRNFWHDADKESLCGAATIFNFNEKYFPAADFADSSRIVTG